MPASVPDSVAAAAEAAFAAEYGTGPGRPVCVVMAALDEAESVADVVRSVPAEVCGLATECLVVDDGSRDATASQAREAGALVCRLGANLGQGRALRSGYRLATGRGARVIATMDADGQFDARELERLVGPVVAGQADMVQGSRRLGRSETGDRVRAAGVVVFGALVSLLTGARITDPANGFRAFRPEVPARVPLRQPQYQTSELLIGALALGFRVIEAPVTVRVRAAGESKKGANLLYGYRFGRAVVTTWWTFKRGRGPGPLRR
jgi:glycosyltransferase involved in cell wall biosynthesis